MSSPYGSGPGPEPRRSGPSDTIKAALITGCFAVVVALITVVGGLTTGLIGGKDKAGANTAGTGIVEASAAAAPPGKPTVSTAGPLLETTAAATQVVAPAPKHYTATFNETFYLDLDAPEQHWHLAQGEFPGSDLGLAFLAFGQMRVQGEAARSGPTAEAADCDGTTDRFNYTIEGENFAAGATFCVATSQGNWVWIKIVRFDNGAAPHKVTLDIVPLGRMQ